MPMPSSRGSRSRTSLHSSAPRLRRHFTLRSDRRRFGRRSGGGRHRGRLGRAARQLARSSWQLKGVDPSRIPPLPKELALKLAGKPRRALPFVRQPGAAHRPHRRRRHRRHAGAQRRRQAAEKNPSRRRPGNPADPRGAARRAARRRGADRHRHRRRADAERRHRRQGSPRRRRQPGAASVRAVAQPARRHAARAGLAQRPLAAPQAGAARGGGKCRLRRPLARSSRGRPVAGGRRAPGRPGARQGDLGGAVEGWAHLGLFDDDGDLSQSAQESHAQRAARRARHQRRRTLGCAGAGRRR